MTVVCGEVRVLRRRGGVGVEGSRMFHLPLALHGVVLLLGVAAVVGGLAVVVADVVARLEHAVVV